MKYYLGVSLLLAILKGEDKKRVANDVETLIQDGARLYTSVFSILSMIQILQLADSQKWRTILHLLDDLVEEILPLEKEILEILHSNEKQEFHEAVELKIAILAGMDELLIYKKESLFQDKGLPLRNFFGKAF